MADLSTQVLRETARRVLARPLHCDALNRATVRRVFDGGSISVTLQIGECEVQRGDAPFDPEAAVSFTPISFKRPHAVRMRAKCLAAVGHVGGQHCQVGADAHC